VLKNLSYSLLPRVSTRRAFEPPQKGVLGADLFTSLSFFDLSRALSSCPSAQPRRVRSQYPHRFGSSPVSCLPIRARFTYNSCLERVSVTIVFIFEGVALQILPRTHGVGFSFSFTEIFLARLLSLRGLRGRYTPYNSPDPLAEAKTIPWTASHLVLIPAKI